MNNCEEAGEADRKESECPNSSNELTDLLVTSSLSWLIDSEVNHDQWTEEEANNESSEMSIDINASNWWLFRVNQSKACFLTDNAISIENRKRKTTNTMRQHLISGDLSKAFQLTNTRASYRNIQLKSYLPDMKEARSLKLKPPQQICLDCKEQRIGYQRFWWKSQY